MILDLLSQIVDLLNQIPFWAWLLSSVVLAIAVKAIDEHR